MLHETWWQIREPAFPHYEWRLFADRVEVWDGQLINFRPATPHERASLFATLKDYMAEISAPTL